MFLLLQRNEKKDPRSRNVNSTIIGSVVVDVSKPIQLRIEAEGDNYSFSYATAGAEFKNVGGKVSGDILSTNVAGGFTGTLLGLYATSANDAKPE
jgi:xylan 1,4-beta-xylosidase